MLKGRKTLAFVGLALIAAGLLYALLPSAEPQYQGHRLSEWLGPSQREDKTQASFDPTELQVSEAIRSTYPKNLPFLIKWIGSDQDRTSRMLYALPICNVPGTHPRSEATLEVIYRPIGKLCETCAQFSRATVWYMVRIWRVPPPH